MSGSRTSSEKDNPELDDLISLSEAAKLTGMSRSHLALLARQNEIWAKKLGRSWITTEKAVREYLSRDIRPGPKPKSKPDQ